MTSRFRTSFRTAIAVMATVLAPAAYGEGSSPADAAVAAPSALTPPKLLTFVEAAYPAAAKAAGQQANVDLEMTIDATGKVTDVRVVEPAGDGFDAAAIEAARRFVFAPALRGARAIPARIKYRYVFELAAEPVPAAAAGELEGRVLARGPERVIAGVRVTLVSDDGRSTLTAVTDAAGAFHFQALPPGRFHVTLAAAERATLAVDEEVAAGELTSVTYRMDASRRSGDGPALEFGATATIDAPPREVTKRTLSGEELVRMAGTRGDPLKAIEYMPGVGRSPQAEFIIIRGSAPADSEVQFEGAPVYRLYHFGGLTSFVQPRLLAKIDLYPGNFSARFGRKMGGIIDVGIRDPKTDGLHGMVDVNIVDSSFLFEGPLTANWSFAVAAKRSYIDLFIDKLIPKDEAQITAAPVYWDYQAILAYKPTTNDRFRAMVYGSYDDLRLILAHPADGDPTVRGGLSSKTAFHRAQFTWEHRYNAVVEHEVEMSGGPFVFSANVGPDVAIQAPGYEGFLRSEWRARMTDGFRLIGGLDLSYNWFDFSFDGPPATQVDGDPDTFGPLTGRQNLKLHDATGIFRPAAYLEAVWQLAARLTIVPGARVDYLSDVDRWTFDPRLTARDQLTASTTLKGGVGLFSQAPSGSESLPLLGNPHLRPSRAQHYSLGIEQDVGTRVKLTAEGFYKRLSALIVNSPVAGENLNNDGIGRIYGAELSARLRPTIKSSGLVSYTLSRSERNDHGTEWRPFSWDQTHNLTIAGSYRVGHGWDLSATFRYVTGNPTHAGGGQHLQRAERHLQTRLRGDQQRAQQRLPSPGPAGREELARPRGEHRRLPGRPERLRPAQRRGARLQLQLHAGGRHLGPAASSELRRPRRNLRRPAHEPQQDNDRGQHDSEQEGPGTGKLALPRGLRSHLRSGFADRGHPGHRCSSRGRGCAGSRVAQAGRDGRRELARHITRSDTAASLDVRGLHAGERVADLRQRAAGGVPRGRHPAAHRLRGPWAGRARRRDQRDRLRPDLCRRRFLTPVRRATRLPSCTGGGGTTVSLSVPVQTGDEANHNPTADRAFTLDGQPWAATVGDDPCAVGPRLSGASKDHVIGNLTDGSDREAYTALEGSPAVATQTRESLQVSQFVTAGKLKSQFSFVEATDEQPATVVNVTWEAPQAADIPANGLAVTFTFVVRDNRGGTDWTTRALCVTQ